ncbi:alpha-amylase family glycosyl hydrolase [Prochlorothrix hollandica]|uniref:1,4-alpha-glucan branching enzyme n=1 Tax=Prochlorothrix hollandica PCC 9006 = CALU 1027 TaxID=317619 RepID=A0A0M2PSE2_PROHO|nr:alpha-amylase family glycosyl hydrolase [Prochlorothrix hollandica]KKI98082.1 1,4-alpha-glucan-branching protein [Prochlorothrix hollandica PCC 9006 = CALU 1027]
MSIFELLLAYNLMVTAPDVQGASTAEQQSEPAQVVVGQQISSLDLGESGTDRGTWISSVFVSRNQQPDSSLSGAGPGATGTVVDIAAAPETLTLEASDNSNSLQQVWSNVRQQVNTGRDLLSRYVNQVWQYLTTAKPEAGYGDRDVIAFEAENIALDARDPEPLPKIRSQYVVSPDVEQLHLAAVELLEQEPELDPATFQPEAGIRFNDDNSLTFRVLVGNDRDRLSLIGDFNNWGQDVDLGAYELQPTVENATIHEVTLPPGNYHKMQYRLLDQYGNQRLDLNAPLFSTPAFNRRFYGDRPDEKAINAVIWKPEAIAASDLAPVIDLRGKPLSILETDIVSLALKWTCQNPDSPFYGQMGSQAIDQLYNFVGECGLPEKLAELGYNSIQFMPLDTHVDFWEPDAEYFPDWRYSYQIINYYGKHADFGSPDELRHMINAFHQADVGVVLDVVYSHYSDHGNNEPRDFGPLGYSQYHSQDGWELYGGPWTEWGTRRFTYSDTVRRNIIDAALNNVLNYGFDGLRIDNVNGIDSQPYGRELLREMTDAIHDYRPGAVVVGEGYFGDPYLNRANEYGGAGLTTTYSDRFYLWFTEDLMKHTEEIDSWRLNYMLEQDWPRALLYYPGNHDEFANPGNPFQTRGRYLVDAINGGDYHNRKIQSWSALNLFASSYYLDMFQLWTLQNGNLNDNAPIEWPRLQNSFPNSNVEQIVNLQSEMKDFFISQPAFAPHNMHRNMVRWIDHDNKIVEFERIDFATGQRVYAVVNLGDRSFSDYKIAVSPKEATFRLGVDSDKIAFGGGGHNPEYMESQDNQLTFHLGSYGVVGFVQEDRIEPIDLSPTAAVTVDYEFTNYGPYND